MGVSAAVATIAGTAFSIHEGMEAKEAQEKAQKEQRAIARAQALRERKQQIRQARIARAQAISQAYTTGGQGSTLEGATGSIQTQLGSNLAFGRNTFDASSRAAGFQQDAADSMFRAGIGSSIASVASPFASTKGLSNPFGGGEKQQLSMLNVPKRKDPFGM